jgi:hypothetical protein
MTVRYRTRAELQSYLDPERLRVFNFASNSSAVPSGYRDAMPPLLRALHEMDTLFLEQDHPQSVAIRGLLREAALQGSEAARANLTVFGMFNGPIGVTLQNETVPLFEGVMPRHLGGTLYSPSITKEGIEAFLRENPGQAADVNKMNTVLEIDSSGRIVVVPYEERYEEHLERAASALKTAAMTLPFGTPEFDQFSSYLKSRAAALQTGDYYESDRLWVGSTEPRIDLLIGPLETYRDALLGVKAFYSGMIVLKDPAETARLEGYASAIPYLENVLPQSIFNAKDMTKTSVPVAVVDVLAMSGDHHAFRPYITLAQALPNDEKVLEVAGRKIFIFKNILENVAEKPEILERLLDPSIVRYANTRGLVNNTTAHEVSHSLGPKMTDGSDGERGSVATALGPWHNAIEELKADLAALYSMRFLVRRDVYTEEEAREVYVVGGLLKNLPKAKPEIGRDAHYVGNLMKLNYFLADRGISFDGTRFSVNFETLQKSSEKMLAEVLAIQSSGDQARAEHFIRRWAVWGDAAEYSRSVMTAGKSKFYNLVDQPLLDVVRPAA